MDCRCSTSPGRCRPSVALRPEPFGALAYHFGNRKLTFLKRPELVAVVRALAEQPDVRAALVAAGVPERAARRRTPPRCAASPRPT